MKGTAGWRASPWANRNRSSLGVVLTLYLCKRETRKCCPCGPRGVTYGTVPRGPADDIPLVRTAHVAVQHASTGLKELNEPGPARSLSSHGSALRPWVTCPW